MLKKCIMRNGIYVIEVRGEYFSGHDLRAVLAEAFGFNWAEVRVYQW